MAYVQFVFHSALTAVSINFFNMPGGGGVFLICKMLFLFSAPSRAGSSAASLPSVPMWALTKAILHFFVRRAMFSSASAVFRAVVELKSILFNTCSPA